LLWHACMYVMLCGDVCRLQALSAARCIRGAADDMRDAHHTLEMAAAGLHEVRQEVAATLLSAQEQAAAAALDTACRMMERVQAWGCALKEIDMMIACAAAGQPKKPCPARWWRSRPWRPACRS
jgi:hypothetical protein